MRTTLAAALLGAATASRLSADFMQYITTYGKNYKTVEEFNFRKNIFAEAVQKMEAINADPTATFKVGFNKMTDWTHAEYKQLLGFKPAADEQLQTVYFDKHGTAAPASVNWVTAGAVQAVRDQGQCGSCWSFSSMGAIESAHWLATGESVDTSEQQLVDCSNLNLGCNGGNQSLAFKYFYNHGVQTEASYPYTAQT